MRIGSTLRALMYHDVCGEPAKAAEAMARLPAEARQLEGVDFGPANAACPHGVDVAAHMDRARRVLLAGSGTQPGRSAGSDSIATLAPS